jgi:uncharacterized protein
MWYIVLSRSLPDKEADKQSHYEEHRQWLDEQHRAGRLLFSGPTTDGAFGVYIMLASSLLEAEKIAAQDPRHLRGIREMQVLEWRAHRAFQLKGPHDRGSGANRQEPITQLEFQHALERVSILFCANS